VLSAEFDDGLRGTPGSSNIAADYFEDRRPVIDVGLGRDMAGFDAARDPFFHPRPRIADLAEQPIRKGKVGERSCDGILAEAELGLTIALWIVNPERLLKMRLRRKEIALEDARHSE
jgi:hypothetical protein